MYSPIDDDMRPGGHDTDGPPQGPVRQGQSALGTLTDGYGEGPRSSRSVRGIIEKELKAFQISLILKSVLSL